MAELVDEEVEERRVGPVLDDLPAPGGIAARVVVVWIGEVGVVVPRPARGGREVKTSTVGPDPAGVAVADVGFRLAEAIEGAVFVCCAWLCEGQWEDEGKEKQVSY